MIENAAAELYGKASKRRALFVIGESGSGKTTAIEKHISSRPQFKPRLTKDGEWVRPMISFEAPKPLTLKGLARTGISKLGYEVRRKNMTEMELFELWKQQLKEHSVLFMHIDEMQHVIRGNTPEEIQNVSDVIKSLLQISDWPLHIILSGVPTLAQFLDRKGEKDLQLKNRSTIIELKKMTFPHDVKTMKAIMVNIIGEQAGLKYRGVSEAQFIHRQIHASQGAFGSMIQMIRSACEQAIRNDDDTVTPEHFAAAYSMFSGCRPAQNIFLEDNWQAIMPENSLTEILPQEADEDKPKRRRRH
jgi:Cdc6-like AAA superfamily ATPase